jgi:tryptophan-rich sensory protein
MDSMMMFLFPVLTAACGLAELLIMKDEIPNWYKKLIKSKLNPPNWIFGPMWTLIYISIGYSGYIIWAENKSFSGHNFAWIVYFIQLVLNYLWTPLFFRLHLLYISFIEIILTAFSIALNIFVFYNINQTAGLILIPYLLWVSFASFLNYEIWRLNKNNLNSAKKSIVN